jgi:thioesterase domain-containing protein
VALLDAADAAAVRKSWRVAGQRLQRSLNVFRESEEVSPARRAFLIAGTILKKVRNLVKYVMTERVSQARAETRMRLYRAYMDRGWRLPSSLRNISVRTAYLFAERGYRPSSRFDGEIVLFRATSGTGADEPYTEIFEDSLLGWGARTTRGVRAFDVSGGHSSMLQEPHVEFLAQRLQRCIDESLDDTLPRQTSLSTA